MADSAAHQPSSAGGSGKQPRKAPQKRKRSFWRGFWRLVACCFCLGVMAASVLAVMLSMYVVEVTADDATLLDLDNMRLAQTSIVYAQDHETSEWVEYTTLSRDNQRIWVYLDEIPENLKRAVICTEDKNFYDSVGVNFKRTIAAAINEYTPLKLFSSSQGASTLEQQLIKNISQDDDHSAMRKVREIFRAIGLDNRYSKDTILEAYLNTISLTGTIAGVQSGAREYFGKDVSELSLPECASIASITQNPTRYNPITNPEQHLERRNLVLWNMYDQGKITEEEYNEAKNSPLVLAEEEEEEITTKSSNNSYFTDALINQLVEDIIEKDDAIDTEAEALDKIYNGGLRIYATVDPFVQQNMEEVMLNTDDAIFPAYWREAEVSSIAEDAIPVYNEDGTLKTGVDSEGNPCYYVQVRTQAAMVTMDYSGAIKALVGGLGEKTADMGLNRAVDSTRQTGSTMKPIAAYSLAIDYGICNFSTILEDAPFYSKEDQKVLNVDYCRRHGYSTTNIYDPAAKADPNAWRDWPSNFDNRYGHGINGSSSVILADALAQSYNTTAVWAGSYVGVDNMFNFAHDTLHMESLTSSDADYAPIVLGSQSVGVTPVELCAAYQIFYEGQYTTPHLYTEVETSTGDLYLDNTGEITTTQAIQPETATIMNRLLYGVTTRGTASSVIGGSVSGMEAVGKTGTTTDNKDYTYVGLTPYYVTSVWWGYDTPYDMTWANSSERGRSTQKAWKALMERVQEGLEPKSFPLSENVVKATYCTVSGDLATSLCASTATGYYTQDNMPSSCTVCTGGVVVPVA